MTTRVHLQVSFSLLLLLVYSEQQIQILAPFQSTLRVLNLFLQTTNVHDFSFKSSFAKKYLLYYNILFSEKSSNNVVITFICQIFFILGFILPSFCFILSYLFYLCLFLYFELSIIKTNSTF